VTAVLKIVYTIEQSVFIGGCCLKTAGMHLWRNSQMTRIQPNWLDYSS